MTTSYIRFVPEVRTGLVDSALMKNGDVMDGGAAAAIANFTYSMLERRSGRVLYSNEASFGAYFASGVTHRARTYPSFAPLLYCTVVYGDSGTAGTAGFATFNVDGIAQAVPKLINTSVASTGPLGLRRATFRLVPGGGPPEHDIDWSAAANSAITAVIVYGGVETINGIWNGNTTETSNYVVGNSVDALNFAGGPVQIGWDLWCDNGPAFFAWSGSFSVASATYTNLLDSSTSGWASTAAGLWAIPYAQATMTETTVPCKLWVYASCTTAGAGRVRIQNSTGAICTITGIGTAGYYSASLSLDPTVTNDLIVLEASATAGTVSVSGMGVYAVTS